MNFLNPERKVQETAPGTALAWTSVTTGNLAGIDLWLDEASARHAQDRNQRRVGRASISPRSPTTSSRSTAAGSAGKLSVYRLPEADWSRRVTLEHAVTFPGGADLPVYVRVTQADGNQAWSSPIYLIA